MRIPAAYTIIGPDPALQQLVTQVQAMYILISKAVNTPDYGTTAQRPPAAANALGQTYFDTTLGYPIWWDGGAWIDATGGPA